MTSAPGYRADGQEGETVVIKVLGSGCANCKKLEALVKEVAE